MSFPLNVWGFNLNGSSSHWLRLEPRGENPVRYMLYCGWLKGSHALTEEDLMPIFVSAGSAEEYARKEGWNILWYSECSNQTPLSNQTDYIILSIASSADGNTPKGIRDWVEYMNHSGLGEEEVLRTLSVLELRGVIERNGRYFKLTNEWARKFNGIPREHLADQARILRDYLGMRHHDWPPNYPAGSMQRKR